MLKSPVGRIVAGAMVALVLTASNASAQATRTWVSGVGDDANPCSRTAPCKTFAGAISKTAAGGEIDCLDPGGFGAVTITKSITIDGGGGQCASILVAGTNGININAASTDTITIRNIQFQGAGSGLNGILVNTAAAVHVENCEISNFIQKGISVIPTTACRLFVSDTRIHDNRDLSNGGGIFLVPTGPSGNVTAILNRVQLHRNTFGLHVEDNTKTSVGGSSLSGNDTHGVVAISNSLNVEVNLDKCMVGQNSSSGLRAVRTGATIRYAFCAINDNSLGLDSVLTGHLVSFASNAVGGNTTDGTPTQTLPLQ